MRNCCCQPSIDRAGISPLFMKKRGMCVLGLVQMDMNTEVIFDLDKLSL